MWFRSAATSFQNTLDLGAKYDVELLANLKINTINPDDFWDSQCNLIDTWNDIDADDLSETNAELYSRSTNDDPSGSPTYGTWEPFANSTKRGRGFQFKVEMETDNDSQDVVVQTLGVSVKLQRRTEQQRNISSGTFKRQGRHVPICLLQHAQHHDHGHEHGNW